MQLPLPGSRFRRHLIEVGALLFAPTVLFIAAPQSILQKNSEIIPSDWKTAFLLYGAFTAVLLIEALILFTCGRTKPGRVTLRAIGLLAAMGLVYNVLQPLTADWPIAATAALDIGVAAGLASVFFFTADEVLNPFLFVAAALFLIVALPTQKKLFGDDLKNLVIATSCGKTTTTAGQSPNVFSRERGNVYHIVLDGFQREAFDRLATDPSVAKGLADFTYFPEFKSAYWRTHLSMPSVLLGEYYDVHQNIWNWAYRSFSERGVFKDLKDAGVPVETYTYYKYYCPDFATLCDSQVARAESASRYMLADLWFLSLIPSSLKGLLNGPSVDHVSRLHGEEESFGFSVTQAMGFKSATPIYLHSIHSMRAFDRFLKAEKQQSGHGRYVFFHTLLPHGPYLYGPDCRRVTNQQSDLVGYMGQAQCALVLVSRLVDELKSLGRYDDALIIVHADHGWRLLKAPDGRLEFETDAMKEGWFPKFGRGKTPAREWPREAIASTADALLLVKFPGKGWPQKERTPVGALELAPTILDHFGIAHSGYRGVPLQAVIRQESKPPVFHFADSLAHGEIPHEFSRYKFDHGAWRYEEDMPIKESRRVDDATARPTCR